MFRVKSKSSRVNARTPGSGERPSAPLRQDGLPSPSEASTPHIWVTDFNESFGGSVGRDQPNLLTSSATSELRDRSLIVTALWARKGEFRLQPVVRGKSQSIIVFLDLLIDFVDQLVVVVLQFLVDPLFECFPQ